MYAGYWFYDRPIPLESEIGNVRKALSLAYQYGFGFTLITKSNRVLRDLDLIKAINEKTKCVVQMTLTTYDEDLCKKIEPNVCTTRERFEALKQLRDAGIPTFNITHRFMDHLLLFFVHEKRGEK